MLKYYEYETLQGDTFDVLALDFYNEESKASIIIQANPQSRNVLVFDEGIKLKIPQIEEATVTTLPPWKR